MYKTLHKWFKFFAAVSLASGFSLFLSLIVFAIVTRFSASAHIVDIVKVLMLFCFIGLVVFTLPMPFLGMAMSFLSWRNGRRITETYAPRPETVNSVGNVLQQHGTLDGQGYVLATIAEEAAEVSHVAAKSLRFGLTPERRKALTHEVTDLLAALRYLEVVADADRSAKKEALHDSELEKRGGL